MSDLKDGECRYFERRCILNGVEGLVSIINRTCARIPGADGYIQGPCVRAFWKSEPESTDQKIRNISARVGIFQWNPTENWTIKKTSDPWIVAGAKIADQAYPHTITPAKGFSPQLKTFRPVEEVKVQGMKPDTQRKLRIWMTCLLVKESQPEEFSREAFLVDAVNKLYPEARMQVGTLKPWLHKLGITLRK